MALKIAFIACLTLLIKITSAADDGQDMLASTGASPSDIASAIINYLEGSIGLNKEVVLRTVTETGADFNFQFQNISIKTVESIVFDKYSVDTALNILELTFHTSLFVNIPYYKGSGTLMTLPLDSEATGSITVDGIYFNVVAPFNVTQNSNGDDILNLTSYSYGFSIMDNVIYNFVFADSKFNDQSVKDFLNDNWIGITTNYSPPVYDALVANWIAALQVWLNNNPISVMVGNNPSSTVSTQITSTVAPRATSTVATPVTSTVAPRATSTVATPVTSTVAPRATSTVAPRATSTVATPVTSTVGPQATSTVATRITSTVSTRTG